MNTCCVYKRQTQINLMDMMSKPLLIKGFFSHISMACKYIMMLLHCFMVSYFMTRHNTDPCLIPYFLCLVQLIIKSVLSRCMWHSEYTALDILLVGFQKH